MPWLFTLTAKKLLEINEHFTPHAIIGGNEQRTRIVGNIKESQSNPGMIRIETEFGALEFSKNQTLIIEGKPSKIWQKSDSSPLKVSLSPTTKGSPREF